MHRSGTSAITRVLNILGAKLPEELLPPAPGNLLGHWEPIKLVAFNDRLLEAVGSRWDDHRYLEFDLLNVKQLSALKVELRQLIIEAYGDAPLFIIKDPRISRFVGFYREVLEEMGIEIVTLLPLRNPLEVAHSLHARDGHAIRDGLLLWTGHVLAGESGSRGPKRLVFSFERLFQEPGEVVNEIRALSGRISRRFDGTRMRDALSFVQSGERHQVSEPANLKQWGAIGELAADIFHQLEENAGKKMPAKTLRHFDEIWSSFKLASAVIHDCLTAEGETATHVSARIQEEHDQDPHSIKSRKELEDSYRSVQSALHSCEANYDKVSVLLERSQSELRELRKFREKTEAFTEMGILRQTSIDENHQPLVSVIVPVKDGMPHFARVIDLLKKQKLDAAFEVLIIDSGSKDGSADVVPKDDARFRLIEIDPKTFGHGRTRNRGIELSRGEYCAFLTHDAVPADEFWLQEIVRPLRDDAQVAGVFGRHLAYDEASPFTKWELETHFSGLRNWPEVYLADAREYVRNQGMRQIYHFYSDNSSCLRKSVWRQIPYPDVNFAEDQLWAKQIVEAGYKKAFAWESKVFHSHDYGLKERLQRSYDESTALRQYFGYNLCPSKRQLVGQTFKTTWRDLKMAVTKGWWYSHPVVTVMRPFDNLARQIGFYLGSTDSVFAKKHDHKLSRDRQLQAR